MLCHNQISIIDYFFPLDAGKARAIPQSASTRRVLFVEEDRDFFSLLQPALTNENEVEVYYASDFQNAILLLSEMHFNLIILDCPMKEFEKALKNAAEDIRLEEGLLNLRERPIPVIVLTDQEPGLEHAFFKYFDLVGRVSKESSLGELVDLLQREIKVFFHAAI